jgi:hypothetical protein
VLCISVSIVSTDTSSSSAPMERNARHGDEAVPAPVLNVPWDASRAEAKKLTSIPQMTAIRRRRLLFIIVIPATMRVTNGRSSRPAESGRGQPHSKTWRTFAASRNSRKRLEVRLSSAAFISLIIAGNDQCQSFRSPRRGGPARRKNISRSAL